MKARPAHLTRRALMRSAALLSAAPALAVSVETPAADMPAHAWRNTTAAGIETWLRDRLGEARVLQGAAAASAAKPTIDGTLVPYDRARNLLAIASNQLQLLGIAGATPELRAVAARGLDAANTASAALDIDPGVHAAMLALSRTGELRAADAATRHYVERVLLRGRLAGADRDAATQARVQRLQARIAELGGRYMANMQQATAPVETTIAALKGLPADFIARQRPDERGVVTLSAASIDVQPVLRFADDPALRQRMYLAHENLAYPANAALLGELVTARAELARELGFESHADLTLADQMIPSAASADAFLDRIDTASRPAAARNAETLRAFVASKDPAATITAADTPYWTERYNRERFGIDGQAVRAYFPFARVRAGIMDFAAAFFALRFDRIANVDTWHPAVVVFDVFDAAPGATGRRMGRIYVDAHSRPGKQGIFATAPLVPGIAGTQLPEGVILCNLPESTPDDPGLMSHQDVVNFLHEFGHLMHHVLGGQGRWSAQGAFDTEEDFLEAPSQMLEEFARNPIVLRRFARHHATGETLPADLVARLDEAAAFTRPAWVRSQLQRARFALAIHRSAADAATILAMHRTAMTDPARPFDPLATHSYAAWPHLVGYGPNYYSYLLDKVVAVDLAARFPVADPTDRAVTARYRRQVLEPGAGTGAAALVRDFLGRDARIEALVEWMTDVSRASA